MTSNGMLDASQGSQNQSNKTQNTKATTKTQIPRIETMYESLPIRQTHSFDSEMSICPSHSFDSDKSICPSYSDEVDVEVEEDGTVSVVPHSDHHNPHTQRQLLAATIAGAFAGCIACGPIFGIPVGAGTAALAVSSESKAGEWTRKGGDAIADAGLEVGERMRSLDGDYYLADFTKDNVAKGCRWTSKRLHQLDDEYHLVDKTKKGIETSTDWAIRRLEPYDSPRAAFE